MVSKVLNGYYLRSYEQLKVQKKSIPQCKLEKKIRYFRVNLFKRVGGREGRLVSVRMKLVFTMNNPRFSSFDSLVRGCQSVLPPILHCSRAYFSSHAVGRWALQHACGRDRRKISRNP